MAAKDIEALRYRLIPMSGSGKSCEHLVSYANFLDKTSNKPALTKAQPKQKKYNYACQF